MGMSPLNAQITPKVRPRPRKQQDEGRGGREEGGGRRKFEGVAGKNKRKRKKKRDQKEKRKKKKKEGKRGKKANKHTRTATDKTVTIFKWNYLQRLKQKSCLFETRVPH